MAHQLFRYALHLLKQDVCFMHETYVKYEAVSDPQHSGNVLTCMNNSAFTTIHMFLIYISLICATPSGNSLRPCH